MRDRYTQGLQVLEAVLGDTGKKVLSTITQVSPEMARLYVEVPFVDIYSRGILDYKTRELLAIAGLTCLGDLEPQLETHIRGAINVGCSREEITETILQMLLFAGFPRALNSLTVAHEVFIKPKE